MSSSPSSSGLHPTGIAAARERHRTGSSPILLNVEDFDQSRYRRTVLLSAAGFHVIEAASAGEALTVATRQPPSVALIDVQLPDASGITLCDTLKRLQPQLPVVMISAVMMSRDVQEAALAAGAYTFLGEPVPTETLVRSVEDALNGFAAQRESDTWVATDAAGIILEASPSGARLLSGTPRGLQRRNLIVFFEQDREGWSNAMTRASAGERVHRSGRLRPKERRPVHVRVALERAPDLSPALLVWTFDTDAAG
jgi:CheY-like chemotaxis protein